MKLEKISPLHKWLLEKTLLKFGGICFLTCVLFLLSMDFFMPTKQLEVIHPPVDWQKLELNVHGLLKAQAGDYLSLTHSDGTILIPKLLLLSFEKKEDTWSEQQVAKWKVEIAVPKLTPLQWKELYNLSAENLYLSPLFQGEISVANTQKRGSYELQY